MWPTVKPALPSNKADVALWSDGTRAINRQDQRGRIGFADHEGARRRAGSNAGKRLDSGAARRRCGDHYALRLWLRRGHERPSLNSYIYTDRPVYRPGHTVHIKAVVRRQKDDALLLPEDRTLELTVKDADGKMVFKQNLPSLGPWNGTAELTLEADAALGYYYIEFSRGECRRGQLLCRGVQEAGVPGDGKAGCVARSPGQFNSGNHRGALLLWRAGGQSKSEVRRAYIEALLVG